MEASLNSTQDLVIDSTKESSSDNRDKTADSIEEIILHEPEADHSVEYVGEIHRGKKKKDLGATMRN